ncbi:MAG: hypothetical protein ACP5HH_00565 [Fervidicoccaceae archaeon]
MKIATIGGGLSGLFSSLKLAKYGCDMDLYEEHEQIGYPKHCTGLVSENTLKMLGDFGKACNDVSFNSIKFEFFGKGEIVFRPIYRIAHLDRVCLEKRIAQAFVEAGGRINLGRKATLVDKNHILVKDQLLRYDHILVAEGIRMTYSKMYLDELKKVKKIFGINVIYRAKNELDAIRVGFHPNIAEGFFYWIFPLSDETIEVGLGTEKPEHIEASLKTILRTHRFYNVKEVERYGGLIGVGPSASKQRIDSLTFLGDAFGLQKPLSGGGIYPIVKSTIDVKGKNCEESLLKLRKNTENISKELRKQLMTARLIQSNFFPFFGRTITGILGKVEIRDIEGLFDYDRHDLILPNLLLKIGKFAKEFKINL